MIDLSIDGKRIEVDEGTSVLNAARQAGIIIPTLCEFPDLTSFGGCRLCVVEIEGKKGYPASCTTPAEPQMVVQTQTDKLQELRKGVLELLLTEHPSACLVCDDRLNCYDSHEGTRKAEITTGCKFCPNFGQCGLQRVVQRVFGKEGPVISMPSRYRDIAVDRRDPFIDRDDNLCILCGRCVRACEQLSMRNVLDFMHRGIKARVGTAFNRRLTDSDCRFCGECIDACPTGTLSERVRRWEGPTEQQKSTTCSYCSLGCQFNLGINAQQVIESLPKKDGPVNLGDACVRGRFAVVEFNRSPKRIKRPMVRRDGELIEVPWDTAIKKAAEGIRAAKEGKSALVYSGSCTNETIYLAHRFARDVLRTEHVDSSLRLSYGPLLEGQGLKLETARIDDLRNANTVLIVGADVEHSHQVVAQIIKRKARAGEMELVLMSPCSQELSSSSKCDVRHIPGEEEQLLQTLTRLVSDGIRDGDGAEVIRAAEVLKRGSKSGEVVVIFGSGLMRRLQGTKNLDLLSQLTDLLSAKPMPLLSRANDRGALEIAKSFDCQGMKTPQIMQAAQKGQLDLLYLLGEDLWPATYSSGFVIVQDVFLPEEAGKIADVVFPAASFTEVDGTYTNLEGRVQRLNKASECFSVSLPDDEILCRLAKELGSKECTFQSFEEIFDQLTNQVPFYAGISLQSIENGGTCFGRQSITNGDASEEACTIDTISAPQSEKTDKEFPFYLIAEYDEYVFRSTPVSFAVIGLQRIEPAGTVIINEADAHDLGIENNIAVKLTSRRGSATATAIISEGICEGVVKMINRGKDIFSVLALTDLIEPNSQVPQELCAVRLERL